MIYYPIRNTMILSVTESADNMIVRDCAETYYILNTLW